MRQLEYSAAALLKRIVLTLIVIPLVLIIPLNANIAAGRVHGVWTGLLYAIGPAGRWGIAIAVIGFALYGAYRCGALLMGDKMALGLSSSGVSVRTIRRYRDIAWNDVRSFEIVTKTARGRTFRWAAVNILAGINEERLLVPADLLGADPSDLDGWIEEARRRLVEARAQNACASDARTPTRHRLRPATESDQLIADTRARPQPH